MRERRLPLPLVSDLRSLGRAGIRRDLVSGLTTAVMLIPQGMAYALLAGLPPVVGLYAALMPPIGYALLGSSRELSVGPVAMDSLLVLAALGSLGQMPPEKYIAAAATLALLVGVCQILMGLFRLGYLVTFLSQPVLSGFTSAAALLIAVSQVPHLLGVKRIQGTSLIEMLGALLPELPHAQLSTLLVSVLSVTLLLLQKRYLPKAPGTLFVIVVATLVPFLVGSSGQISVVGSVPGGLPSLKMPLLDASLVGALAPSALMIALVGFMESIAVGRIYAKRTNYFIHADRELLALGLANSIAGVFRGYPVAGGFARTAVNAEAGARSALSTLFSSAAIALTLLFLTPIFAHIPKAALAAIIVTAVYGLFDWRQVRARFRVQRSDGALLLFAFLATALFGIMVGLTAGILASVVWFVLRTTRPHIAVLGRVPGTLLFKNVDRYPGLVTYDDVLIVRLDAQLYFANAEFLRDQLSRLEAQAPNPPRAVILDASSINHVDSSAVDLLEELDRDYAARHIDFYLTGVKGPVRDILERSEVWAKRGSSLSCISVHEALETHTAKGGARSHSRRLGAWPGI